ncbi:NnrS family protein [Rhizobium sp. L1K21]|uniref:NnrS family protein n=1 Tax=Rhizobium sp. L1K21 TaxID=2954933 RepID=UPI00209246E0|nr:NnrS family protein [Rhizobium sp. L1K21]MCO6187755.1 NnrS family protein [Rhizobium sp. L1K21]
MAKSSAEQMRHWNGPAIFTFGFRPFFLFGSIWAGLAMVMWILALTGAYAPPSRFDPISWHAHAFIFGYLGAVIAGFLLTAVPNWTGRLPVVGWRLAALAALWFMGRIAVSFSIYMPAWVAAALDLLFPVALSAVILREIIAGSNWRNLIVLVLLAFFTLANLIFHMEAALGDYPAQGVGLRLSLAAVIMMIGVIGGRIIPSFTRNWLAQRKSTSLPVPPMQRLDKAVLIFSAAALLLWVLFPDIWLTGLALLVMGVGHLVRLARWKGMKTGAEALVAILHLGYLFVPFGALALGAAILGPDLLPVAAAQHLWMAGAIGTMTLAVMTRATLGHTGHTLHAGGQTVLIYAAILGSTLARFIAGFWPGHVLFDVAGMLWCAAFFGFAIVYGPMLLKARSSTRQAR